MGWKEFLAMARQARSDPSHYQQVKVLIHELRTERNFRKRIQTLRESQSLRLYNVAREYGITLWKVRHVEQKQ